jgi:tetratricopeptide (TPR) repeat protein
MAKARELGHEASIIDMQCGMVHYQRQQWREAEAALGRAIERDGGQADAMLFFVRAAARQQLGDLAAAATDFDIALERPSNTQAALELLPAFEAKDSADLFSALRAELPRGHEHAALVYPARAFVRARLGRFAEAEQDFDAAIRPRLHGRGRQDIARPRGDGVACHGPGPQCAARCRQLGGDAALYAGRGVVRRNLGRFDDALADFASALARGADPAPVLVERAVLHLACARYDEAAADCEAAFADPAAAAAAHSLHGLARQGQERLAEAEADFAFDCLGRDDAFVPSGARRAHPAWRLAAAMADGLRLARLEPRPAPG